MSLKKNFPLRFKNEELRERVHEAATERRKSVNEYINEVLSRGVKPLRRVANGDDGPDAA